MAHAESTDDRLERARGAIGRGELAEAGALLAAHLGQHRDDGEATCLLGVCLYRTGRSGEARALFGRALQLDDRDYKACHYLGLGLEAEHRIADALGYFRRAARLRRDFKPALEKIALYAPLPGEGAVGDNGATRGKPVPQQAPVARRQSTWFRFALFLAWLAFLAGGAALVVLVTQTPLAGFAGLLLGHLVSIPVLGRYNRRRKR